MKPALSTVLGVTTLIVLLGGPFVAVLMQTPFQNGDARPDAVFRADDANNAGSIRSVVLTSSPTTLSQKTSRSKLAKLRSSVLNRNSTLQNVFVGYEETSSVEHFLDGSKDKTGLLRGKQNTTSYDNTGSFSMSFCRSDGNAKFCKTD